MPSKSKPRSWRREFLRVLSQGASIRRAALVAGVDNSTAHRCRRRDPHFAKLWGDALAAAHTALDQGKVPKTFSSVDVRSRVIRSSKTGKASIIAACEGCWNEEVEEKFFTILAATGNVREAARQIEMTTSSLYKRRSIWPAFDQRWDEVIVLATERLAVQLLMTASNLLEPPELPLPDLGEMSVDQAIRVAQLYEGRRRQNGSLRRYSRNAQPVDVEAVKEEIIRKAKLLSSGKRL